MDPTPKSAHNDATLSAISVGYKNPMFVADSIFPIVRVGKQSDYYYQFLKGAFHRNEAGRRAPGAQAHRGDYKVTPSLYKCEEYAFGHVVPIELINNADVPLRPFESGARFATQKVMLAKEKLASDLCTTAANWTSSNDAEGGWAAAATTNTFIVDVETYKETIRKLIGVYPNKMVISANTMKELKQCGDVLDRIKYTGTQGRPAAVTAQALAALFELDEVLIAGAIYSDAEEVAAGTDFNAVNMWEVNANKGAALLYYQEPNPAIEVPSAGYCFNWPGDEGIPDLMAQVADNNNPYRTVRYYWEKSIKSYVVEASEYLDLEIVCKDAGCLFYDTIAD
ncbi:MAG: hypothetical protein ACOWWM_09680 [Desulfobacterales bacterium]